MLCSPASRFLCSSAMSCSERDALCAPSGLRRHVEDRHVGQPGRAVAVFQREQLIAPLPGAVKALDARGGRGKQQQRPLLRRAEARHVPRVVARGHLRLIGALLLLVDDDEPRCSPSARTTALRVPTTIEAPPFLIRFHSSSRSVIESPLCSTATRPPKYRRNRSIIWGVREISGHHHDHPAPAVEHVADGAQEDLRLARAGHAVEERGARLPAVRQPAQPLKGGVLLLRQHDRRRVLPRRALRVGAAVDLPREKPRRPRRNQRSTTDFPTAAK